MKVSKKLINEIKETIVKKCKPKMIVLFGSYSTGNVTNNSDIDIFIVMNSRARRDKRIEKVDKLFSDRDYALDIIIYTPKELESALKVKNSFAKEILDTGKVIYKDAA